MPVSTGISSRAASRSRTRRTSLAAGSDTGGLWHRAYAGGIASALVFGLLVTGEVIWHAEHNHQVGIVLREWAEHEDPLPRFVERVGQVVTGRVTKIASIGFFVRCG